MLLAPVSWSTLRINNCYFIFKNYKHICLSCVNVFLRVISDKHTFHLIKYVRVTTVTMKYQLDTLYYYSYWYHMIIFTVYICINAIINTKWINYPMDAHRFSVGARGCGIMNKAKYWNFSHSKYFIWYSELTVLFLANGKLAKFEIDAPCMSFCVILI